jgi:hypothetical protein
VIEVIDNITLNVIGRIKLTREDIDKYDAKDIKV